MSTFMQGLVLLVLLCLFCPVLRWLRRRFVFGGYPKHPGT